MQLARIAASAIASAALVGIADAQIYISEVCDGTLTGGQPKWVQVTNCSGADIPDLSIYSIGNYSNGGTTLGGGSSDALNAVALADGASYAIAYETDTNTGCDPNGLVSCFEFTYGTAPDQFIGPFTNGDDAIALFLGVGTGDGSDATLLDTYGVIGVDGTGLAWEYTDGYSRRCVAGANLTFTESEWFFGGVNSLEDPGGDDTVELNLLQTLTTPFFKDPTCPAADPVIYCTAKLSSSGCTNIISTSAAGAPTSGANDYSVTASNVQGFKNGLLFAGISGPTALPFSGGILCVTPPTKRGPLMNSGGTDPLACDGSYATNVNDGMLIPAGLDAGSGNTAWYQYWYRDPANGLGNLGTALSDAVELEFN